MNDAPGVILAFLAGLSLGGVFFFGLWWTVRRSLSSERPVVWILGSLLLRMSLALSGLYLVGRGNAGRLLFCLLGMMVARFIVLRVTGPSSTGHPIGTRSESREAGHAS